MSAEVFGLTQQILMLISAYINTGVCGKLRIFGKTATVLLHTCTLQYTFPGADQGGGGNLPCGRFLAKTYRWRKGDWLATLDLSMFSFHFFLIFLFLMVLLHHSFLK